MHADCCGIHEDIYRVLVDWQSAGRDDIWPCKACASQHVPHAGQSQSQSQAQSSSSSQSQSRRRRRSSDAGQSQAQSQSQSQTSSSHQAAVPRGPVQFVEVGRGGIRLCVDGFSYTKKAEKKTVYVGSVRNEKLMPAKAL